MDLDYLNGISNLIVIGHRSPDIDSIVSSKIIVDILKGSKIEAKYAIIEGDNPNEYNMSMINDCMQYNPFIIKENEISNYRYFLVDHNDLNQSVLDPSLVVGCIDHHHDAKDFLNHKVLSSYCCTALFIFKLFYKRYCFTKEQKKQIFLATLNDSNYGLSSRYHFKDSLLINKLGYNHDFKKYFKKYFITTDLSKNINEVFKNNSLKKYDFDGIKFKSSSINSLNSINRENYMNFIKNNKENFLGIWYDYEINYTYVYFKYNNSYYEFTYNYNASRSQKVIKDVLKIIKKV